MIFKIKFLDESFSRTTDPFKNFCYSCGFYYINTDSEEEKKELLKKVKDKKFLMWEVTRYNYYKEPDVIKSWVEEIFSKEDFEKEQQEALIKYDEFLDFLEKDFKRQLAEKEANSLVRS